MQDPVSTTFATALLAWQARHGRHDLPWQHPRTPYRVWLSEVMLQQTQVAVVIPYFQRFIAALPELPALAAASEDQVLALWAGLGYYSRARNLRRAAIECMAEHGGELPTDIHALRALPGIGRSTAAAILAQAHGLRHAILDGNAKRVLARWHGVEGWPGTRAVENQLWAHAETHTPAKNVANYTQAIMDLGATVCTRARPSCGLCPVAGACEARLMGRTGEIPAPRPRKALPRRQTHAFVLRDAAGRIWLERRGPGAVWEGLWSLPEGEADPCFIDALARRCGSALVPVGNLAPLEHGFSHYHLTLLPRLYAAGPQSAVADAPGARWFAPGELNAVGLPAPVRRLLDHSEEFPWPEPSIA